MKQLKKTLLTLVALLAVTTGAWADEKMVTINSSTMSSGAVTATGFKTILENIYVGPDPATITTSEGVITKLVIKKGSLYANNFTEDNVGVTPGTITYGSDEITVTDINAESVTLSRKGSKNWSPSSVDVYYAEPSPSSGPKVAWDKDKKTGSFTMPGGNVTLEPEYYPQAALTAAPTAINDVPATTDGAIVSAGTVANIGETTKAQGTVMYYVSPTALDDAALLALAADQWTADVPTAADLAQGQAYVYYYVRGNDSDTDDEIFSDGDILAANALTVTIAAAPTYAVTFADDIDEPDKWTASPAADVKKGQTVTVTYTGTKKVIGVKAEKKAKATYTLLSAATAEDIGKVVCAAGHLHDAKTAVPDGCTAVGILGKVTATGHGLILSLQDATEQKWNTINGWTSASYAGTTLKVLTDDARGTNLTSYTALGETTVSNWAVAQKDDYEAIFTNLGTTTGDSDGMTYDANVNAYITTGVGGTAISGTCLSATGYEDDHAWYFNSAFWNYNAYKEDSFKFRPVLGF